MTDQQEPGAESMQRLREQQGDQDVDVAHAARLVASARQREVSDEQSERIWRRVQRSAGASRATSRVPAMWLRPAMVGAVLVGMAGIALASVTVGRRLLEEWRAAHAPAAAPASSPGAASHRGARAGVVEVAGDVDRGVAALPADSASAPATPAAMVIPVGAPDPAAVTGLADPAAATPAPTAATSAHARAHRVPSGPDPAASVRAALNSPEVQSIIDAVNALRRDGDNERARMHLTFYLQHFPDGLFHEEALALAVEAAEKARDAGEAGILAERYLKRYPEGRYRANAERVAGKQRVQK